MDIQAEALQRIAQAILAAAGSADAEAGKVAAKLVGANLAGHDSHGVIRVPQYGSSGCGRAASSARRRRRPDACARTDRVAGEGDQALRRWPWWRPSANSSISLALNAGRSSGLRLVTRP